MVKCDFVYLVGLAIYQYMMNNEFIHSFFSVTIYPYQGHERLEVIPADLGEGRGNLKELMHRDKQPSSLTFTCNLESRREPTQTVIQ